MPNDNPLITDPAEVAATLKQLPAITSETRICPECDPPVPLTPLVSFAIPFGVQADGKVYRCDHCRKIWTFDD